MEEFWRDKEWLVDQYVIQHKPIAQISKEFRIDTRTITKWLKRHDIPIRSFLEYQTLKSKHSSELLKQQEHMPDEFWRDKDWLYDQYITKKKSLRQLSKEFKRDRTTFKYWLEKHGIPIKSSSESTSLLNKNHFILSKRLLEFLYGELLGDMCIRPYSPFSATICYTSQYHEYIYWLDSELRKYGIKGNKYIKDKHSGYLYSSLCYKQLLEIRNYFYTTDSFKIVPDDLKLTPITLRQWYIGDGNLEKKANSIRLCTDNFKESDVEKLIKKLESLGIYATKTKVRPNQFRIRIRANSLKTFFEYIGDCPKEIKYIYGYKWAKA